ncbi:SDR family oxidoreductase [Falsibacillus albus]|uniref:SDR family oxidoreductase n=1 Tax=Falsibacillus albus TaxID=2478915 RepID=A0A3L7K2V4_9BACI|nr:SDR family NAD(P)-dependent oxidoreductase [Falsibacillus albus]RLQ97328.1 SDR family oxidoreductase [Falsibacillus albus]
MKKSAAIITGSSRGIGFALAQRFASKGMGVVINGTSEENVCHAVEEIRRHGGSAQGVVGSVQDIDTGKKLMNTAIDHYENASILINNAGTTRDRMAHRLSIDDWNEVIHTHLTGTFSAAQPFILHQKSIGGKGCIINMTSTAGLEGNIGQLNYSAAKAGILGMTWTLAKELEKWHVPVFAVAPAALTDMTRPFVERARNQAIEKGEPLDPYWEIGTPEQVAEFVFKIWENRLNLPSGTIYSVNGNKIGKWSPPAFQEIESLD